MARFKAFDLVTLGVITVGGIYMGTQFFGPLVIDQLKKDGNLRTDIDIPEFDKEKENSPWSEDLRTQLVKIHEQELQQKALQEAASDSLQGPSKA